MSLQIIFTDTDWESIADEHNETVADRVEHAVEQKNETLEWKSSLNDAKQRFYNVVENNGECFPEMFIMAHRTEYRALLAWLPRLQQFAFLCVVKKSDHYQSSKQHELLEQVYKHPHRVITAVENELQQSTDSTEQCA